MSPSRTPSPVGRTVELRVVLAARSWPCSQRSLEAALRAPARERRLPCAAATAGASRWSGCSGRRSRRCRRTRPASPPWPRPARSAPRCRPECRDACRTPAARSNSQRLVHLEEVEVAADLDRAVAGVERLDAGLAPPGVDLDVAVGGDDLARHDAPWRPPAACPAGSGSCTVTSLVPSGKVASTCSTGMSCATPGITSSLVEDGRAERDQLGHRAALARALEDLVRDDGGGLRVVELQALGPSFPRQLGRRVDGQPFQFGRCQQHALSSLQYEARPDKPANVRASAQRITTQRSSH